MKKYIVWALLVLCCSQAQAETIKCKPVKIITGDTFTCEQADKKIITVKLNQIEAPTLAQAYGQEAKRFLSRYLDRFVELDIYGDNEAEPITATGYIYRMCSCYPMDHPLADLNKSTDCGCRSDINKIMIDQGYAWHSPFSQSNPEYIKAEQEARNNKRGLWADPNPIAPWQ